MEVVVQKLPASSGKVGKFREQISRGLSWLPFHVRSSLGVAWSRLESMHNMASHRGRKQVSGERSQYMTDW